MTVKNDVLERLKKQKAEAQSEEGKSQGPDWFAEGRKWAESSGSYTNLLKLDESLASLEHAEDELASYNPPADRFAALTNNREMKRTIEQRRDELVRLVRPTCEAFGMKIDLLRKHRELAFARGAAEFFREVKDQLGE